MIDAAGAWLFKLRLGKDRSSTNLEAGSRRTSHKCRRNLRSYVSSVINCPQSPFLADDGAISLNRTEGWTQGDPTRFLTPLASLAALSALAPIAKAEQGNALHIGMADDLDVHIRHTVTHSVGTSQHALQAKLQASTRRAGQGQEGVKGYETAGAERAGRAP